jgi:hypothetical protein
MEINYKELIKVAHEHQKGRVCYVCKEHKPLTEFYRNRNERGGHSLQCKACFYKWAKSICPVKKWFAAKKKSCKYRNKKFTIEPTDIPGVKIKPHRWKGRGSGKVTWIATEYPKNCPECGTKLGWGYNKVKHNSPSLDCLNPDIDYLPGNVMIVCMSCNLMKFNCPPDEWDIIKKKKARYILFGKTNK